MPLLQLFDFLAFARSAADPRALSHPSRVARDVVRDRRADSDPSTRESRNCIIRTMPTKRGSGRHTDKVRQWAALEKMVVDQVQED